MYNIDELFVNGRIRFFFLHPALINRYVRDTCCTDDRKKKEKKYISHRCEKRNGVFIFYVVRSRNVNNSYEWVIGKTRTHSARISKSRHATSSAPYCRANDQFYGFSGLPHLSGARCDVHVTVALSYGVHRRASVDRSRRYCATVRERRANGTYIITYTETMTNERIRWPYAREERD